ncbi:unnamed protein product [Pleuronectes platessa]|uniref:Uncharacterized protein n=1 Tax=Pleuronectes platessa TaxID=8262 RepID=A0A9N7USN7_PLEPL|nr:unnamed protein product [Pleuronectes platessa]
MVFSLSVAATVLDLYGRLQAPCDVGHSIWSLRHESGEARSVHSSTYFAPRMPFFRICPAYVHSTKANYPRSLFVFRCPPLLFHRELHLHSYSIVDPHLRLPLLDITAGFRFSSRHDTHTFGLLLPALPRAYLRELNTVVLYHGWVAGDPGVVVLLAWSRGRGYYRVLATCFPGAVCATSFVLAYARHHRRPPFVAPIFPLATAPFPRDAYATTNLMINTSIFLLVRLLRSFFLGFFSSYQPTTYSMHAPTDTASHDTKALARWRSVWALPRHC